ncbi:myosin-10 isoform X2 [Strongylocentrotus purpuratus]|uniref:Leucine-, glutamate- and lysine-rich protein 1 n=1 Tax=Strongylocentrotus purpuratus TaxID=7668 RepID=A0A7M7P359_STRPU|nr:myosin-10 isoform X2 [Strongylocentrotus purpuratus]
MSETPSNIERLPLEHPLPDEIQEMTRDDTVCKFCGVSYLIHHEVKRLEKELEKVEAELQKYKGCEERERVLKIEVEKLKTSLSEKDMILHDREASIEHLKSNIKVKEDELWKAIQQAEAAQKQLESETAASNKLREWRKDMMQRLPLLKASLSDEKQALGSVKSEFKDYQNKMAAINKKITGVIQKVCKKEKQVVEGILSRATEAEKLSSSLQSQLTDAQQQMASNSTHGQMLQEAEDRIRQMTSRYAELEAREQELQDKLQKASTEVRSAKSEAIQFKEILRNKTQEVEDSQRQRAKHEQFLSNSINKLQEELRCRAEEAQDYQRELGELKEREAERKRRVDSNLNTKMEASARELRQLQEALDNARKDCSALRDEREAMVASHQHRIEQLKQSFAQRIQEADGWPEKLNESLSKEREKHAQEIASLEERLHKSFQVDLEIQKQRNDELILKYKQELSSAETKMKNNIQRERDSLKARLDSLERELFDSKKLSNDQEKGLREEIESLKRITAELRKHVAEGDSRNTGEFQAMRAELQEAEQDLASVQRDKLELQKKLDQNKEEVAFLQETVGRECEERLELTEALSKAREQLLVHQRGTSIANSTSTGRSSHSQLSLGGSSSPHQPTSPKGNPPSGLRRGSGGGGQSGGSKGARNSGSGGGGV